MSLIRKLKKSKEYRDAFVDSEISVGVPFQIRALREQRSWSQKDLADATSMLQPRICAMEQAGYGNFTLNTLKKLASAFDVGLVVKFAPFGELVNWADNFSPDTFSVPSSVHDPVLKGDARKPDLTLLPEHPEILASRIELAQPMSVSSILRDATMTRNLAITSPLQHGKNSPTQGGAELAASATA
jgi:transcriptional regulator with XRE-family HTH domain